MTIETIALSQLRAHPANSNVMPARLVTKLAHHIQRTDRYPPVIVRPLPAAADEPGRGPTDGPEGEPRAVYQILDGHHRVAALERLGRDAARCVVWDVDDDEALLLLATLNRLQGDDDPLKRAALVAKLESAKAGLAQLATLLPEDAAALERLKRLNEAMPPPRAPMPLEQLPVAVHFFLLPAERDRLEARLKAIGPTREEALMTVVGEGVGRDGG